MTESANEHLKKPIRDAQLRSLASKKRWQEICPHQLGQDGVASNSPENSSFCFCVLPTGETVGICLHCQKIISSIDPDDELIIRTAWGNSGDTSGSAGQFLLADDEQFFAQAERLSPEERDNLFRKVIRSGRIPSFKPERNKKLIMSTISSQIVSENDKECYEMPMDELKKLAQEQIKFFHR